MKVVIIEDEKPASDNLVVLLHEIDKDIQIEAILRSVDKAVEWFRDHPGLADLILMDIKLSDDLSFSIFELVKVNAPVIFTTAYNQYAIRAFKHHSIDYLLKPIDKAALSFAIDKYHSLHQFNHENLHKLVQELKQPVEYKKRFLVNAGKKIKSIPSNEIAFIQAEGRYVRMVTKENSGYMIDYTLEKLEDMLDPECFFRINRQFIIHVDAISNMQPYSKGRIKINLNPSTREDVVVSIDKAGMFKKWLNK